MNNVIFENRRVLFIAPKFYNYHTDIISFMERKGANVTYYPEDIYTPLYRTAKKLFPRVAKYLRDKYVDGLLNSITDDMYDIVFVIRGGILSPAALEYLKEKLPAAKFVMYQWDSMKQSRYEPIIKYFDIVKTFDHKDANDYNLVYLPLFYTSKYLDVAKEKKNKKYDLVFYGAYHSDRLEIVKYIDEFCKKNNLQFKYHLYITKMALCRLLLTGRIGLNDLKYLKTYSIDAKEILEVYKESLAILDIELNIQNGLTMRTFEALGAGLKLITTNKNIKREPFYNEKNIMVIDRYDLDLDLSFFQTDFSHEVGFEKYMFENWLDNLFSLEANNNV